jgi:hypothetical protein
MVDEEILARLKRLEETAEALRRVRPSNRPTHDDIAYFHELHARHEREQGREERARAAEARARRVRTRHLAS